MKLNIVPARTGIQWVKLGLQTFLKQPLALAGLFFMYLAAMFILSAVPLAGPVLAAVLVPGTALGMMAASLEASRGRFPMPSVMLSAFRAGRQRVRAMLVLGLIYAAGSILVLLLSNLLFPMPTGTTPGTPPSQEKLASFYLSVTLLHLPLTIMFWHAPALVHWHDVSPVKSLFFSTVACFRNLGAFLVYVVAWLAFFILGGSIFGLAGALIAGPGAVSAVLVPLVLLFFAMFTTSIYFTFRDSFVATAPDEEQPPGGESP